MALKLHTIFITNFPVKMFHDLSHCAAFLSEFLFQFVLNYSFALSDYNDILDTKIKPPVKLVHKRLCWWR
jgi:hypothetical protein